MVGFLELWVPKECFVVMVVGFLIILFLVCFWGVFVFLVVWGFKEIYIIVYIVVGVVLLKIIFSVRLLYKEVVIVKGYLDKGEITQVRVRMLFLVS